MFKTMRKIIFTTLLLMVSTISMAQNEVGHWTLTPKVGVNLATLTDPDIYVSDTWKMEYSNRVGVVIGGEGEYQLNKLIGLSAGLLYSQQGTRQKDNPAFRDAIVRLDYLNVPVTANVYIARNVAIRLGLQAGWALSRRTEGEESDGNGHWEHYDSSDTWYRAFDLSLPLGLSWAVGSLQFDARYNFGLTNITKYDTLKQRNRVIQLTVGYRFEL